MAVVDGKCGSIEHSWLVFCGDGANDLLLAGVILDPYAPGRLPAVQLIDPIVGTAYRPGDTRTDIKQSIVDSLVDEMRGSLSLVYTDCACLVG